MDEVEFDIGDFKERLNNFMVINAPSHFTLRQCEDLMVSFCYEVEKEHHATQPEAGE